MQSTIHGNIGPIIRLFGNASVELGEGCGKIRFQAFEMNYINKFTFL